MPNITTVLEPSIFGLGRFSEPVSFVHAPFSADCITNMFVFRFSVHTGIGRGPANRHLKIEPIASLFLGCALSTRVK